MIFNLKSRIEQLERIVNEMEQHKRDISLDEIEIKGDTNNESKKNKTKGDDMSEEEVIIALVAVIGGIGFLSFVMHNIFSLIRTAIERKKSPTSSGIDPQFFRALADFKKSTESRLNNLETIISEEEDDLTLVDTAFEENRSIEIEEEHESIDVKKAQDGNLRNMLNE